MSAPQVRIRTNYGTMTAELRPDVAPLTTANFLQYAREGFYAGTLFHRVIPGFVIQGGGLGRGMYMKSTRAAVENEAANGLKNERFTLAMARLPSPHSATSQFFINLADNAALDHRAPTDDGFGYCVFGKLVDGMDVAAAIGAAATEDRSNYQNVPAQDIVIEAVEVAGESAAEEASAAAAEGVEGVEGDDSGG